MYNELTLLVLLQTDISLPGIVRTSSTQVWYRTGPEESNSFVSNCYQDESPGSVTRLLDKHRWERVLLRWTDWWWQTKSRKGLTVESKPPGFTHPVIPTLGEDNTFVSNIPTKIFSDTLSFPGMFYQTRWHQQPQWMTFKAGLARLLMAFTGAALHWAYHMTTVYSFSLL